MRHEQKQITDIQKNVIFDEHDDWSCNKNPLECTVFISWSYSQLMLNYVQIVLVCKLLKHIHNWCLPWDYTPELQSVLSKPNQNTIQLVSRLPSGFLATSHSASVEGHGKVIFIRNKIAWATTQPTNSTIENKSETNNGEVRDGLWSRLDVRSACALSAWLLYACTLSGWLLYACAVQSISLLKFEIIHKYVF